MGAALVGLAGVVVGAFITAVFQAVAGWRTELAAALSGARVVRSDATRARELIEACVSGGRWLEPAAAFRDLATAWRAERASLAQHLDPEAWDALDAGLRALAQVADLRARHDGRTRRPGAPPL